jgi:TusA-related sulfurtransferase
MSSSWPSSSALIASSPGDTTLDLTGEVCPFTFVRTKLALEQMPVGATLQVIVDHAPASRNVPRSAAEWGQEVIAVTPIGDRWRIDIRKRIS